MAGYLTDGVVHKFSDGTLEIHDGSTNDITVEFSEASLTWSKSISNVWHSDRGVLDHRRAGHQEPVTVSFSVKYTALYGQSTETPYEALTKTGLAAAWTSTTAASSDVYSVDIVLVVDDAIGTGKETMTLDDFAYNKIDFAEGEEANMLTVSGDAKSLTITTAAS